MLEKHAQERGEPLNYKTSIVDLMKAIGQDSSLDARKKLAGELGYTGDTNDSATMNIWLHEQTMEQADERLTRRLAIAGPSYRIGTAGRFRLGAGRFNVPRFPKRIRTPIMLDTPSAQVPALSLADEARDPDAFAAAFGGSFERFGFAVIADHGIPQGLIERAWKLTEEFFALPVEEKQRYYDAALGGQRGYTPFKTEIAKDAKHVDLKEFWHVGRDLPEGHPAADDMMPNVWPSRPAEFKEALTVRNPLAITGLVVLVLAVLAAVLAPWLAPHEPTDTHLSNAFAPPGTAGYVLGTDDLGRDVLSRIMFGLRASLHVGLLAVATSLVIGVPLGLMAGYFRAIDALISRLTDLVLAFPFLILAVGLAAIRGASLGNAAIAIGIAQIPGVIRIVRSETLRLKSLDFVSAAIVEGAGDPWVLGRHILPNAASVIIVQATVAIPAAILGEAVLSFLGLGIQPPSPQPRHDAVRRAAVRIPRTVGRGVAPGLAIMLLTLAFNIVGDSLRDAIDPKASRR